MKTILRAFNPRTYPVWGCIKCGRTLGRAYRDERSRLCPYCQVEAGRFQSEAGFWRAFRISPPTTGGE